MRSIIVGTAGHIDHGKTALVKALTGIDADRLEEEKRRGITIDIGFAHLELPGPAGEQLRLGFVDVPGHERFVRNMLAGVGGIDMVLLVIAADEGIKPQTREHFDICRMLAIPRGITVLTKSDMLDRETLDVVRLEIEDFLRGSFLDAAPMVAVSSKTGAGIDDLKRELAKMAMAVPGRDADAPFRLPIDRVFVMKGFGTVVTGTTVSGRVHKEEEVEAFPAGKRVRVRGVQVHGSAAEEALAGQRTALNLAGIEKDALARGMTLAAPGLFRTSKRFDVQLSLLKGARPLKNRARVHLHAYTAETIGEVRLFGDEREVRPGATAFLQVRTVEPLLLFPGDRFIVRQFSPVVTIGGGMVLDNALAAKDAKADVPFLAALATGNVCESLKLRIARRTDRGLSIAEAIAETGWSRAKVESAAATFIGSKEVERIGDTLLLGASVEAMRSVVESAIRDFHARNPLAAGISREELRGAFDFVPQVFDTVIQRMVHDKKLELSGELVRLAGRGVVMKDEEAEAKQTIERAFSSAGLKVPALKEVLVGLALDRARAQKLVTLLLREKTLVKISEELVFHREALAKLRSALAERKTKSPKIDVAAFKEMTGVSRKYAIPLLEYLDRERVTRREGDARVIL